MLRSRIIGMGLVIIVVIPVVGFFHSMIMHQTLLGNFPMSIRWLAHRYLLNQSVTFYQDDFVGRIATKVMQTSLAIRETVMKFRRYAGLYHGLFLVQNKLALTHTQSTK